MWKLGMPAVAALVATVATAAAGAEARRPAEAPALGPSSVLTRLVADMSRGRYERAWLTLHPVHRRIAARWEYASCERLVPFGKLESVTVLDLRLERVTVPGVPRPAPGAAVTILIRLWQPAGQPPLELTHTAHLVRTGAGWSWMLPAGRFEDYRADRCPSDPAA